MNPSNTAVTNQKPQGLKALINSDAMRNQFAMALPKHLTAERFTRIAITALTRTPKLQECTPESFMRCLLDLSALGIEPDGRRAHLIPYGKECTLILDYKGIAELVMRSGVVSSIHADKVCEEDDFEVDRGKVVRHRIDYRKPRGKSYAYYVLILFKDGSEKSEVMTREEVDAIRRRSKAGSSGPWQTDFDEMGKKTVFRRASKWLPLSPEIRDAMEKDGDALDNDSRVATGRVISENPMAPAKIVEPEPEAFSDLPETTEQQPIETESVTSEKEERAELLGDIRETLAENEFTLAKFAPLCRKAGLLADGVQLPDAPIEVVRAIHANRLAILKGEYKEGGEA
jgi:recombination protein RecT